MGTTDEDITYKIKTNVPNSYLVRPNCGILKPGAKCEVQLVLKANEPNIKPTNKDRFMVLIQRIGTESTTPLNQLWEGNVPDNKIEKAMIFCKVTGEEGATTRQEQTNSGLFYSAVVHSEVADKLKKQNEELCAKAQQLQQENKHLEEEQQKREALFQSTRQEIIKLEEQLNQIKNPPKSSGALLGITGQGVIALIAFFVSYLLGLYFSD